MSKTKLTYITPVLDFVQAESEGLFFGGGGEVYMEVIQNRVKEIGEQKTKTSTSSSMTPMQISSTWTDSRQRDHTN